MFTGLFLLLAFVGPVLSLFGTNKFFFYHDSTTKYKRNDQNMEASVACWNEPQCNLTVSLGWDQKFMFGGIHQSKILIHNGCPPVVCPAKCNKFVMNKYDKCPICECKNYFTREPCRNQQDCPENSRCSKTEKVCRYTRKRENWRSYCTLRSDCPPFFRCEAQKKQCYLNVSAGHHVQFKYCSFKSDCEDQEEEKKNGVSHVTCEDKACVALEKFCTDDTMCYTGYECNNEVNRCMKIRDGIFRAEAKRVKKTTEATTTTTTTTTTKEPGRSLVGLFLGGLQKMGR